MRYRASQRIAVCIPAVAFLVISLTAPAASAEMVRRSVAGDAVMIHELGIVVGVDEKSDGTPSVIMLMPKPDREVEIVQGDLVLMLDGERIKDIGTLKAAYDGAEIGSTHKLGLRRGDRRFLASFERAEQDPGGPGGMRMVIGGPGSDFDDMEPVHELLAVIGEKEGALRVAAELPMGDPVLKTDDTITSLNGEDVTTLTRFREIYAGVEVGKMLTVVVTRGDETLTIERPRASSEGRRMMIRSGQP